MTDFQGVDLSILSCIAEGCDRKVLARKMCSTHYSYWHRANNGRNDASRTKECAFCGGEFHTKQAPTRYCSLQCGQRDRAGWSRSKEVVIWVNPKRPTYKPVHVRAKDRFTSGKCRSCGAWFVSRHMNIACSEQCQLELDRDARKRAKDRRRALKRDAFVAPVYRKRVFEADGYRCHICGKRTNKSKTVPHPNAPTLDHLIPLAAGGTHEPKNCRTACFKCNSHKGARDRHDQLLLFAV